MQGPRQVSFIQGAGEAGVSERVNIVSKRSIRADEVKETGSGQVMQVLEILSRSSRAEEFGLYPTYRVVLLEAFLPMPLLRSLF